MDIKRIESVSLDDISTEEAKAFGLNTLFLEEDGTYDWIISMNMTRNESFIRIMMMIYLLCCLPIVLIVLFLMVTEGVDPQMLGVIALVLGIIFLIFVFATWVTNLIYRGQYMLVYQMNQRGITFSQTADQAQITSMLSATYAGVSALGNNPGGVIAGTGLAIAPNGHYYEFSKVLSVKGRRDENLIWVNSFLAFQMVYVPEDAYDFIWDYITRRCTRARISQR